MLSIQYVATEGALYWVVGELDIRTHHILLSPNFLECLFICLFTYEREERYDRKLAQEQIKNSDSLAPDSVPYFVIPHWRKESVGKEKKNEC